jgi:hypothetical protein
LKQAHIDYGRQKKYYGVAANLTAFACKRSYEFGYDGAVSFTAKSRLIEHYKKTLGAKQVAAQRMIITGENARKLVSLYFKDFML